MLRVENFLNELMSSNCYIVWDDLAMRCIVIDPASEKSLLESEFIDTYNLVLDYIILTHEHTDHTWGVNSLLEKYNSSKVICSEECKMNLPFAGDMYFQLYYDLKDYHYEVARVDLSVEELRYVLEWAGHDIQFINTPGHSMGSICISIDRLLFTGDTIMITKPYIDKHNGSRSQYLHSVQKILSMFPVDCSVFPGHGEMFHLKDFTYTQTKN